MPWRRKKFGKKRILVFIVAVILITAVMVAVELFVLKFWSWIKTEPEIHQTIKPTF